MAKNVLITEEQLLKVIEKLGNMNEQEVKEGSDGNYMTKQQLFSIATLAYKMWEMLEEGEEIEDWMESKIAQCDSSITSVVKAFMYDDVTDKNKSNNTLNMDDLIIGT